MEYSPEEDQFANGFDAGQIQEGVVTMDPVTGEFVIVGDDGLAFSIQSALRKLEGKKVRLTCISMQSMDLLQKMLEQVSKP